MVVGRPLQKQKELTTPCKTPKLQGCTATRVALRTQGVPKNREEQVVVGRPLQKQKELTTPSKTPKLQGCPATRVPDRRTRGKFEPAVFAAHKTSE